MHVLQINLLSDWQVFFGHFHPVVVHLPIGILFIAFVLEMARIKTHSTQLNQAVPIILFWGFITAVVSCVFGWLLSASGDYNEDTLFWHQWMGITVAFITGLLWILKKRSTSKGSIQSAKIYTSLITSLVVLLLFTGHLGGNMTHGEDYLTANTPQPFGSWLGIAAKSMDTATKKMTDINEALIYADLIAPILETKCWNCHNASKKKGGLRMDTDELLMKGGKHGVVIKPKDANGSEIITRLLLPKDDDKRMPPKGKPGPTVEETELIKWWIAHGASFQSKVKEVAKTAAVEPYFTNYTIAHSTGKLKKGTPGNESSLSAVYLQKIPAVNKADMEALKQENLIISPVAQHQNLVEISAVNTPGLNDEKMKLISKLAQQVTWLKLSNTKITDAGIKAISNCSNLVKLNIGGNAITNISCNTIKHFQNLETLNIVGTMMDDNGLMELGVMKSLKNIYCWQTKITEKGAAAFKKINPGVTIDAGAEKEKAIN